MAKNISLNLRCMLMGFEEKQFQDEKTKVVTTTVKVRLHDKATKNDLDCKFQGTMEEFIKLNVEEYEMYDANIEMKLYKSGNNQCVSFILNELKEV